MFSYRVHSSGACGARRRLTTINRWLAEHGHDVVKLWESIDDAIIKTLISCQPALKHNYRTCFPHHLQPGAGSACFEILGFDVLLTSKLKPKVLEVNHSPSFSTDAQIDIDIKEALIWDTFQLINLGQARLTQVAIPPSSPPPATARAEIVDGALLRAQTDRRRVQEDDRRRVKQRLLNNVGLKSQHADSASSAPTAPPATSTTAGWFFKGNLSYGFSRLLWPLSTISMHL